MIGKLTGTLLEKNPPEVLLDCHGVGYEVNVPMSTFYNLPAVGERVSLLTQFIVREDAQLLYGFATAQERQAFRELIKISGVGPRTALSILSGMGVADLAQAITLQEAGRLVVGSASSSTVDAVVTLLVQSLEGMKVHPINTTDAPVAIMTGWLADGEPDFEEFTLGRACELKADDELRSAVRYSRAPLDTDEVKTYVRQGMRAKSLEMTHCGRVAFTLGTGMQITGIEFLDVVMEGRDGDMADSFGADVALATGELRKVLDDVIAALGGEVVVTQEGGGE